MSPSRRRIVGAVALLGWLSAAGAPSACTPPSSARPAVAVSSFATRARCASRSSTPPPSTHSACAARWVRPDRPAPRRRPAHRRCERQRGRARDRAHELLLRPIRAPAARERAARRHRSRVHPVLRQGSGPGHVGLRLQQLLRHLLQDARLRRDSSTSSAITGIARRSTGRSSSRASPWERTASGASPAAARSSNGATSSASRARSARRSIRSSGRAWTAAARCSVRSRSAGSTASAPTAAVRGPTWASHPSTRST